MVEKTSERPVTANALSLAATVRNVDLKTGVNIYIFSQFSIGIAGLLATFITLSELYEAFFF